MIARVPKFLRSSPTPPMLRRDPRPAPLLLSPMMRAIEPSEPVFTDSPDRIDQLFATL